MDTNQIYNCSIWGKLKCENAHVKQTEKTTEHLWTEIQSVQEMFVNLYYLIIYDHQLYV